MRKNQRNRILIILGVIIAAIYFAFPIQKRINLGLDLKGGMHLILRVDTEKVPEEARKDAVLRAIEILRKRIDGLGVGETVIQRQGDREILVQLPGITDREKAINLIGKVAQLEFRIVNDEPTKIKQALEGNIPEGYILKKLKKENGNEEDILVSDKVALNGDTLTDARVDLNSQGFGEPQIAFSLNMEGSKQFGRLTKSNVNKRLAIILDGRVLSAPNIKEPILGGHGVISGNFTFDEASNLSLALRSGALPAPMHIEEERTIGPLLGQDSINSGLKAAIMGASLVFIFMIFYYLAAGIISTLALVLNLLIIFGTMGFLSAMLPESPLTLTLPGIAGIILTLGMSVDANVLINERIREEIRNGRPLQAAINNGYGRALSAIVDSNATTLIASFMLFQFGSGPIKGFAVTLSIGLISSLFTALFVTRTIFNLLLDSRILKSLPMLHFFHEAKIDFVSKRFFCFALSLIIVAASIFTWVKKGDDAYGIDFTGGQIQELKFTEPVSANEIREPLKNSGFPDAIIQQFEQHPENVIIRTSIDPTNEKESEASRKKILSALTDAFPDNKFEVIRIERVGPVVGKALRKRAILAILTALGGILIYVGFRFKHFDFGTAGVIALLHDVIITMGLLLILGRQIDLLIVTALLTIAGYSINDTIIIYDRVRENMPRIHKSSLRQIINDSINQTLGRTILTTITTLLVVFSLFLHGGEVLNTFALALLIGFISGTYSTIFIATPLVLAWEKKKK